MKVVGYWLLVIGCSLTVRAELKVEFRPEAASLFVYEPFTLIVESNQEIGLPDLPSVPGFSIITIKPGPDRKTGRIEVIADQPGTLNFPPFTVRSGEETVQTPPLRLTVSAPRPADEMHLSIHLSSTNLYVNEPVELTVTWSSRAAFTCYNELIFDLPLLRHTSWSVYPLDPGVPEADRVGLPVNYQRVIARKTSSPEYGDQLVFSFMLIPGAEGVFRPAPAQIHCALLQSAGQTGRYPSYFDNHFFAAAGPNARFERVFLSEPFPGLTVRSLPEKGRTARYSGITGPCTASAAVQPAQVTVGQPMLLTVTLDQLRFGPGVPPLPETSLADLGSEFRISPAPIRESASQNSRSFTYILRPLRSGITTIPALALQVFDPEQHTYRTVRTEPIPIRIDPDGEQTFYQPFAGEPRESKTPLIGIRGNRKESRPIMNTCRLLEFLSRHAWSFWLLPPLVALALRPWFRHRDRCRTDPAYARASRAARRFRHNASRDEETAWKTYLADRLNLSADAVTFGPVQKQLEKQNVPEELIRAVREQFSQHDTKRYAPQGTQPRPAPSARALIRQIEKATRLLLLLACLLPALTGQAATPDEQFEHAMNLRNTRPDEARPLFVEAALGFEAEAKFINAGNSWFFAGENGRALASYLSAEQRNPFDRKLRESIAFIRAQRTSTFQTSVKPGSKFSKAWQQFSRWDSALRFGLLTLIYLIGWALCLTARFIGKTIPRRVWIGLGMLALIPALSLLRGFFLPPGGVLIQSAEARLGPGYAYDKAYDAILHEATEFQWMEERNGWIRARMPDGNEAWLRESACIQIR